MSFDWGGFTGGIVGTIGAFGVAVFTFRKQDQKEMPAFNKRKYLLLIQVLEILRKAFLSLKRSSNSTLASLGIETLSYHNEIEALLPDALEVDFKLHETIRTIIYQIYDLNEWNRGNILGDPGINKDIAIMDKFISDFKEVTTINMKEIGDMITDIIKQGAPENDEVRGRRFGLKYVFNTKNRNRVQSRKMK